MPAAVIVDVVRSPIGRAFKGSLASLRPDDALAQVIDALLARNEALDPALVQDVICGCGLPQGVQAFNVGRAGVLLSERLPETTTGVTVSRFCASGLDAIRYASNAIAAGQGDVMIAAGVEFVSSYSAQQETANPQDRNPRMPSAYVEMGVTAEHVARRYGVSRAEQDEFAQRSQERAVAAQQSGAFAAEIVPLTLADGASIAADDGPRPGSSLQGLARLRPAFDDAGTVTAGNSSPLNDGAAAALLMSADRARALGLAPRARIVSAATHGNDPALMGVAPIEAIAVALQRAGMTLRDIDLVELNEAFAAQALAVATASGIDHQKLNVHGGAIALGHPYGMTGVRIMATLLNAMAQRDATIGLETMCVAGGQGEAVIFERLA
ncbi:MAG TPA: acetyl-CoA C-acyltransferase [Baekduia sp.]|nr:acetyl-CoA C-acyltransferase [Baekduia sp.]